MSPKAAKAPEKSIETDVILYDASASQIIPLTLTKNGKTFPVSHTLAPASDEDFFKLELDVKRMMSRLKDLSTAMYAPKDNLWQSLVESRAGYRERADWKEATHQSDRIAAITALFHTQVMEEDETDVGEADDLYDDESLTAIQFRAAFSGALLTITHSFRAETAAEMDEYMALVNDQPNRNTLASTQAKSRAEKLADLGQKILVETDGYAETSRIPAWHLAATTESFFLRQVSRMGKSSPE